MAQVLRQAVALPLPAALAAPGLTPVAPGGDLGRAASTSHPPWPLWPPPCVAQRRQARQSSSAKRKVGSAAMLEAHRSPTPSKLRQCGDRALAPAVGFTSPVSRLGWQSGPGGPGSAARRLACARVQSAGSTGQSAVPEAQVIGVAPLTCLKRWRDALSASASSGRGVHGAGGLDRRPPSRETKPVAVVEQGAVQAWRSTPRRWVCSRLRWSPRRRDLAMSQADPCGRAARGAASLAQTGGGALKCRAGALAAAEASSIQEGLEAGHGRAWPRARAGSGCLALRDALDSKRASSLGVAGAE